MVAKDKINKSKKSNMLNKTIELNEDFIKMKNTKEQLEKENLQMFKEIEILKIKFNQLNLDILQGREKIGYYDGRLEGEKENNRKSMRLVMEFVRNIVNGKSKPEEKINILKDVFFKSSERFE